MYWLVVQQVGDRRSSCTERVEDRCYQGVTRDHHVTTALVLRGPVLAGSNAHVTGCSTGPATSPELGGVLQHAVQHGPDVVVCQPVVHVPPALTELHQAGRAQGA